MVVPYEREADVSLIKTGFTITLNSTRPGRTHSARSLRVRPVSGTIPRPYCEKTPMLISAHLNACARG